MKELDMRELLNKLEENELRVQQDSRDLHEKAIDYMDDMLDALGEEERYSEKGDVIRHILKCLQSR